MAYNAIAQSELDAPSDDDDLHSIRSLPSSSPAGMLYIEAKTTRGAAAADARVDRLAATMHSWTSTSSQQSYELVEEDDYAESTVARAHPIAADRDGRASEAMPPSAARAPSIRTATATSLHSTPRARPARHDDTNSTSTRPRPSDVASSYTSNPRPRPVKPTVRTASADRLPLRHPTPDLHTLQGAYVSNVEHLEKTAERLSMTSSIEDAIRELHDVQKRADSRRSSLRNGETLARQFSNPKSIVDLNNAARSGGYSPGGYFISPIGSLTGGLRRSESKSSRFSARPEPEREGRPLEAFVSSPISAAAVPTSPQDESLDLDATPTMRSSLRQSERAHDQSQGTSDHSQDTRDMDADRPPTPRSTATIDRSDGMFDNFDGVHYAPSVRSLRSVSLASSGVREPNVMPAPVRPPSPPSIAAAEPPQRRQLARPKTYIEPDTGQQMVYYPAPVPMVLNLPQRLSRHPPAAQRDLRRSQILGAMPNGHRQSTAFLRDSGVPAPFMDVDMDGDPTNGRASKHASMLDREEVPPQLRASAFFEIPTSTQTVELEGNSAVTTLDSILDASAHAPVTAFTDHLYAGHLGAEVYGKSRDRLTKTKSQLLTPDPAAKRNTGLNVFGRRPSSNTLLKDYQNAPANATAHQAEQSDDDSDASSQRRSNDVQYKPAEQDDTDEEESEDVYEGPPTTLLAELQLRKQQQKQRTRPVAQAYPNGMHSTLVQLDTVAQIEKNARKQKRVNLAWESAADQQDEQGDEEDEVPLGVLYASKTEEKAQRPLGLMERRELEDSEPLSRRRDRLLGIPPDMRRATTIMNIPVQDESDDEGESLAQRAQRLREAGSGSKHRTQKSISEDFASELLSQFGSEALESKGAPVKTTTPDADETLGQRRTRIQAERKASGYTSGTSNIQRSMTDLATPSGKRQSNSARGPQPGGLLAEQERRALRRASTMANLTANQTRPDFNRSSTQMTMGQDNTGGGLGSYAQQRQMMAHMGMGFPMQAMGFNVPMNPMSMGMGMNASNMWQQQQSMYAPAGGYMGGYSGFTRPMASGFAYPNMMGNNMMAYGMGFPMKPTHGQFDRVEQWRQSVMQ